MSMLETKAAQKPQMKPSQTMATLDSMQKKSGKTKGGKKIMKETPLNRDANKKIKLL